MATAAAPNATSFDDPMSPSVLIVAIVCGVIIGLLLGWATLEASYRARRKFSAWVRWKMGFEAKQEELPPVGFRASQSAVWDAKENGYPTPKLGNQTSDSLPIQATSADPASSGITTHQSSGEESDATRLEAVPPLRTPQKVHSVASPASHYSYYNIEDLRTPRGQFAISNSKPSLESFSSEATPTKGSYQVGVQVPKAVQTKLNRT